MEESKVQALHDTLSKLKKSAGLGVSSHYNFGKVQTKEVDGKLVRADGLPNNPLYFPFVREGTYDKNKSDAARYGDGRAIKRNFDDISDDGSDNNGNNDNKKKSKEERKAEKKAAKLEAKRQAKLEEKRRIKKEEKRLARLNSGVSEKSTASNTEEKEKKKRKVSDDDESKSKKKKSKKSKKSKSWSCRDIF